jgi:hypothetical protein
MARARATKSAAGPDEEDVEAGHDDTDQREFPWLDQFGSLSKPLLAGDLRPILMTTVTTRHTTGHTSTGVGQCPAAVPQMPLPPPLK